MMDNFNGHILQERLAGRKIGGRVCFFEEVGSTNSEAFRLAMNGAPDGTVVIADAQTGGKGRLNRIWQSPPERNIYTSIILRPSIEPAAAPQITMLAGVAVAELLSVQCSCGVTLKWPNDVQINGKKVCGILTEMRSKASGIDSVIVGIGINVNMSRDDIDETFRETSTSLMEALGRKLSRVDLTVALFGVFERLYGVFLEEGFGPIRDLWLSYCNMVGRPIRVAFKDDIQFGQVLGIDEVGALLIADGDGIERRVIAGDATILKDREME